MLYLIHAFDKADHLQTRMDNRPEHVAYLKSFGEKLHAAGPTLDAAENMNGSLVILDLADLAEAEAFATNDPYEDPFDFCITGTVNPPGGPEMISTL